MTSLTILSGGAAHGLVASLAPRFKAETGFDITGEYGAVGAMADKLRRGQPTDLVILTAALVAQLAGETLIVPASIQDVGLVETALAVRAGDPKVSVRDAADLRAALLAADAIFVPDTKTSTAGLHVASVLQRLGIADEVATRLGSRRTVRPPCGNWLTPTRSGRSAVRSRPKSSPQKASSYRGRCPGAATSRRCIRPASPRRLQIPRRRAR